VQAYKTRAVWDLEHLATLSDAPSLVLVVSERTSYILHNLAEADICDPMRYALSHPVSQLYLPVCDMDGDPWELYLDAEHQAGLEILEVGHMPLYGLTEAVGTVDTYPVPGAGSYNRGFGPVPAGEMWEIQAMEASCVGSNPAMVQLMLQTAITVMAIKQVSSPGAGVLVLWDGRLVVGPGNIILYNYQSVGAGSTLYSRIWFCKLVQ